MRCTTCVAVIVFSCCAALATAAPQSGDTLTAVTPRCPQGDEADALEAAFRVLFTQDIAAGTIAFYVTCGRDSAGQQLGACPEFLARFSDLGLLMPPECPGRRSVLILRPPNPRYPQDGGVVCGVSHIIWHSSTEAMVPMWRIHTKLYDDVIGVRVTKMDGKWSGALTWSGVS